MLNNWKGIMLLPPGDEGFGVVQNDHGKEQGTFLLWTTALHLTLGELNYIFKECPQVKSRLLSYKFHAREKISVSTGPKNFGINLKILWYFGNISLYFPKNVYSSPGLYQKKNQLIFRILAKVSNCRWVKECLSEVIELVIRDARGY